MALERQGATGWWAMYPATPEEKNASTAATAWTTLALYHQLERKLVAPEQRDKVAQGHTQAQGEREQFGAFLAQRVSRPVALSGEERDRLFQEFLNWTKARERR